MISNDKKIADKQSFSARRMVEYGNMVNKLDIMILGYRNKEVELSEKTTVIPTTFKLFSFFYIVIRAIKINNLATIDIISAQDPFLTGFIGFVIKKLTGAKLQLQVHTDFLSPYFRNASLINQARYFLALFLLPYSDGLRVVSERIRESIHHKFPQFSDKKIIVLPIFTEEKSSQDKINLKERYPNHDFIILMASRFTKEKNISLAIEAVRQLIVYYPRILLLIVGNGPLKNFYFKLIKKHHLANSVKIENWSEDLSTYFKQASLFLLTSNYEGYGRTLVEAAQNNCQIISSDVGIARNILEETSIFPPDDLSALIQKIELAINQKLKHPKKIMPMNKSEYLQKYLYSWEMCL